MKTTETFIPSQIDSWGQADTKTVIMEAKKVKVRQERVAIEDIDSPACQNTSASYRDLGSKMDSP